MTGTALEVVEIANDHWRLGIVPENGAAVAYGKVRVGDAWVDILRPTPTALLGEWWDAASYPLLPWSNRIRHGTLLWQGKAYQLRRWGTDDFAMHGTVVYYPWTVADRAADRVTLEFDSRAFYGVNFPWAFAARIEYALDGPRFVCRTTLENVDSEAFPAGMGHHPYFVRSLTSPDGSSIGDEVRLQINCEESYPLTNCMPDGPAGPLPPVVDFREMRSLGTVLVDDCLTARSGSIAATLEYPGTLTLDIAADELLGHVVVFIPVDKPFLAVEPVSNANDAFTLHAQGVSGTGVITLAPKKSVTAEFSIAVR